MGVSASVVALYVGLPLFVVVDVFLLLLLLIIWRMPQLPADADSRRQMQLFLIRDGFFQAYCFVQGLFNGKPFIVNLRDFFTCWLKPKPGKEPGLNLTVQSSTRIFDGVKVEVYEPITREETNLPGLLYFHGGGFMVGSTEYYDPVTRKIAATIRGVVVSVECLLFSTATYRLAPENPFPAGFDDCMAATKYFFKNCHEFGVDPTRVAICGDSAGGNLAAGVVQELCYKTNESQGLYRPKLQVLIYPVLHLFDVKTPSYQRNDATFGVAGGFLSTTTMLTLLSSYLGCDEEGAMTKALLKGSLRGWAANENAVLRAAGNHDFIPAKFKGAPYVKPRDAGADPESEALWEEMRSRVVDNRVMPLYKEDLCLLPPAYIITCDFDVLRDDGVMYAERLREAGVAAILENYGGAFHGLMFFSQFRWAHNARTKLFTYLSQTL